MQNTFPGIQTLRRYRRNMSRGAGMDQVFVGSSARLMQSWDRFNNETELPRETKLATRPTKTIPCDY